MSTSKKVIFLMGPTAAGKTALALNLATKLPVDLISVDSAMIYRGMDIGTGKPTPEELKFAPHALINILDPKESYSAAEFCQDAYAHMEQSIANGRIPILVGGTMMYYQALQAGLSELPHADPAIRAELLAEAKLYGWSKLYASLQDLDPLAASRIHPNDQQRIERALEVIAVTGMPFSAQLEKRISKLADWQIIKIALAPASRENLHTKIATRFHLMLQQGLVAEVNELFQRPDLHLALPAIRSVGYRQIWQFLAGQLTQEEMITKSMAATRQLAKRQFTWLRSWSDLFWVDSDNFDLVQLISWLKFALAKA